MPARAARGLAGAGCLGLVLGLGACSSDAPPAAESLARATAPIIAGTASTSAQDAVVLLALRTAGVLALRCTATLVAPNLLLTARHCVSETDPGAVCAPSGTAISLGAVRADLDPAELFVFTGVDGARNLGDAALAAARGKQLVHEPVSTLCNADLAFILLDRSVTGSLAPLRLKIGARVGEKLTAVGWGLTDSGAYATTRMQRPSVPVTFVGPQVLDTATGMGLGASEFLVGEALCAGDSGGPSLSSKGAVVGVVSRGGGGSGTTQVSNCIGPDVANFYTRLSDRAALVGQAFALAGATPIAEGDLPGAAAGESCTTDVDCISDACVASKCAVRCDDGTACVAPEVCTTFSPTTKICELAPASTPPSPPRLAYPSSDSSSTSAPPPHGCSASPHRSEGTSWALALTLLALVARASRRSRP